MKKMRAELIEALLRDRISRLPARALGLRSAAFPVEEDLLECAQAVSAISASAPRPCYFVIGAFTTLSEPVEDPSVLIAQPHEAAAYATRLRNTLSGEALIYLCSARPPGEAGLTELFEVTGRDLAMTFAQQTGLSTLAALATHPTRRLRERLEMADFSTLWRYYEFASQEDHELAELYAAPTLELIPKRLTAEEQTRPALSWAKGWDKLLGTRAENLLSQASRALDKYAPKDALDEPLKGLCPAHIKQRARWAARVAKDCAALASGQPVASSKLIGLNQALLKVLMKGDSVIEELLGGDGEGASLSIEERAEQDALEHLTEGDITLESAKQPSLLIKAADDMIRVKARRPGWALSWILERVPPRELVDGACFIMLRSPRPLTTSSTPPTEALGGWRALDEALLAELPPRLKDAFRDFFARRRALVTAIEGWIKTRLDEEATANNSASSAQLALTLLEVLPLTMIAQHEDDAKRYVESYGELMKLAAEEYTSLKGELTTWILNLDVAFVRTRDVVSHARLMPTHPLAIERALLWLELHAPPPMLPQLLAIKGSPDLINLDHLRGQGDGLYLSTSRARPTSAGLASATRVGIRHVWRVLSSGDLISALDVEIVDAQDAAAAVNAAAAELSELFSQDADVGRGVHAQLWFSYTDDDAIPPALASEDLSELALELVETAPSEGLSLTVQRRLIKRDSGIRRHLVITSVATPFSSYNTSSSAADVGLSVEYTPGPDGNIQSARVRSRPTLDHRHAFLEQLGHSPGLGLSAPELDSPAAGAISHTLVSRGGWPIKPSEMTERLFAYAHEGDHFIMTLLDEGVFQRLLAPIFGEDLEEILKGLLSLRDLREILPKAITPGHGEANIVGARGKLRGFQALLARATRPSLALNLDGEEGLRWSRAQAAIFGSQQRADLLILEADHERKTCTRLRVIELKARASFDLSKQGAQVAKQAQIVAQRLRDATTLSGSARRVLSEGLRALVWLGAGYQREALRWSAVIQDLERRLERGDPIEVTAEVVVVLHGCDQGDVETLELVSRASNGEPDDPARLEEVTFLILDHKQETFTKPPNDPGPSQPPIAPATKGANRTHPDTHSAPLENLQGEVSSSAKSSSDELEAPTRATVRETTPELDVETAEVSLSPSTARERRRSMLDIEARYRKILALFDEFGVDVSRPPEEPHHEGPGFYIVRVVPGEGVKTSAVERLTNDLKLKLGLEATQEPRSYIDRGAVVFEVPKRDEERYYINMSALMARTSWRENALYAPIGEDLRGDTVGIDFSSSDSPHLLIAGTTGSGKSIALESIIYSLVESKTPDELELYIIDPKGTELGEFERYEHQRGLIGFDGEDAIEILEQSVEEMQRRLKVFKRARARSLPEYNRGAPARERIPWRLIVLDEYADLISDKDERKAIEKLLQRLAQKARSSGIHLILATQKPSAEVLSTVVRSNLPAQLALRVKTASDSRIILDEGGAEALAGKGDAFFKTARGMTRIQCAKLNR